MTQPFSSSPPTNQNTRTDYNLKTDSGFQSNSDPPKNPDSLTHKELKDKIILKVGNDLANIEKALRDNLTPHIELVSEIAGHLLFSGGKRLRPLLMLLSSRLCSCQGNLTDQKFCNGKVLEDIYVKGDGSNSQLANDDLLVKFSTIFEYLHAATLLHDDVVDEAQMRRGRPAAHSRWSVPKVVLTGDFLLARSLNLAAQTGIPEIISIMAGITEDMSQGEIDQMEQKGRLDLSESEYLRIIKRKTAVLIQGACRSGAIIAHKESEKNISGVQKKALFNREEALEQYGYHLGIAFQMADDLLDYTGDAGALGKNPGADIREGKLTLPLIHALSKADDADRKEMENIIRNYSKVPDNLSFNYESNLSSNDTANVINDAKPFALILEKIHKYHGIEYTELQAHNHVRDAKKCLDIFESCEAKELLVMLADYSISRKV